MINLLPINKKVRDTLVKREMAVSRLSSNGRDILEPQSEDTLNLIANESMKSLWVKMFSVAEIGEREYRARLYGGEVFSEGGSYHESAGYSKIYGRRSVYDALGTLDVKPNELNRPLPGIIDFTCQYKGGLFAIRESTINWVAWDLEDLERLIPHFASPGKGVLLEWGYQSSFKNTVADNISEQEMKDGKAYTRINEMVLESGGTYDGMCGVISNFEWSLRDDGGFDVQTTIVSRGVNVLSKQLDQPDAPLATTIKGEDGKDIEKFEVSPTLPEFISALREQIITLSVGGLGAIGGEGDKSREPSNWADDDWNPSTNRQPPGVAYFRGDSWFNTEKNVGPYITWGWMEDNILNKWCAKLSEDGKITNQFRSIEPVSSNEGDGSFLKDGGGSTNNIEEAVFQSVVISNNEFLMTPHLDRWVLPGQFPFNEDIDPLEKNTFNLTKEEMIARSASYFNNGTNYHRFSVEKGNKGAGGYLRNILIHCDLIEDSFKEAKTLQQGLQRLFDEINRDVNGFWSFQVVNDPFIPGNIKVIDTKATLKEPSQYIKDRKQDIKAGKPKELTEMFVFDTWGEKSIVKSQTLSVKLPSSFAVTAMYAGISNPNSDNSQGDGDAVATGKMHGAESTDLSQKKVYEPNKLFDSFGSVNPNIYQGAGSTDKQKNKYFGSKKGHAFDQIDWTEILKKYANNDEDKNETKEDKKTIEAKQGARDPKCIQKFVEEFKKKKALYDSKGNLKEKVSSEIVYKRVMNNILSGTIDLSILKDGGVKAKVKKASRGSTDLLPIECEIVIQGLGGIFPGNLFHVSYIPKRYRELTLFQAMSVDHAITDGVWNTTIKGQVRIATDTLYDVIDTKDWVVMNPSVETKDIPPAENNGIISLEEERLDIFDEKTVPPIEASSFEKAFRKARDTLGENKAFTWRGGLYSTRYVEEGYDGTAGLQSSGDYTNNVNFRTET